LDPDSVAHLEYVRRWVKSTISVKQLIEEKYAHLGEEARLTAAIQENVLAQLEHLREYPFVASRMDAGKLHLNGWIFDVGKGEVFDYDPEHGEFLPLSRS
jgi:carbonic anhydrase